MAITRIAGNLRRTTGRNSKPDMPGMLRSERRMSGISFPHLDQCGEAIFGRSHSVPDLRKQQRQRLSNRRLIVYDEDSFVCAGHRPPHQRDEDRYWGEYPIERIAKLFNSAQAAAGIWLALELVRQDGRKGTAFQRCRPAGDRAGPRSAATCGRECGRCIR